MIGAQPDIKDIDLDLQELVLPQNLLAEESLSPDADPEEEEQQLYWVDTCCGTCKATVRVCVFATSTAVCTLQFLLQGQLSFVCILCSKGRRHGRPN
ncbi:E7 [Human papillomavirus]|uniref:Protein E7 n=1 Tax=Human papillomavirus TaxID=10566 RepID=A0A0K1YWE1_9PAPI|nr:E7 [Human papillomavirus]AKZ17766.1 E7 [Human papillomavirus]AYA93539.1 MAG: E7 protein [Human papillomavirus]